MRYTHTNIAAKDWKQLAAFYQAVFGCTVKPPERNLSGDWLDQAIGLTGAVLQGVHLVLPGYGPDGPTLEIFSYADSVAREPLFANHHGFTHIAFEVDDVDDTYAEAMRAGAKPLGTITEKVIEGLGVLKFVYLRDPEGNIVEIQSWRK